MVEFDVTLSLYKCGYLYNNNITLDGFASVSEGE
jgi:hypothetical protein